MAKKNKRWHIVIFLTLVIKMFVYVLRTRYGKNL